MCDWRVVSSCPLYEVSRSGVVRRIKTQRPLKPTLGRGYHRVVMMDKRKRVQKYVHRIVAEAFIENPDGKPQVNHINGVKLDNRAENLEWVTPNENITHSIYDIQTFGACKLTPDDVEAIRYFSGSPVGCGCECCHRRKNRISQKNLARLFGVTVESIQSIVAGRKWTKH